MSSNIQREDAVAILTLTFENGPGREAQTRWRPDLFPASGLYALVPVGAGFVDEWETSDWPVYRDVNATSPVGFNVEVDSVE